MKIPASLLRFMLEAGFLVLVAAAAAIARLSALAIVLVMGIAWLLVALVERTASRDSSAIRSGPFGFLFRSGGDEDYVAPNETAAPASAAPRVALRERLRRRAAGPAPSSALERDPQPWHVRVLPGAPAPEPAGPKPPPPPEAGAEAQPAAELPPEPPPEPVPDPVPEPQPEPDPPPEPPPVPRPELRAVPPPAPPRAAEPAPPPDPAVVAFTPRANGPRRWNLWDLERMARDREGADAARDEERAMLLMQLRQFASADGMLSEEFDGLVRESFPDLIGTAAR